MGRSEEEFYKSNLSKTIKLIELHGQFKSGQVDNTETETVEIMSMKQIPGFI